MAVKTHLPENSLWANRKCLWICLIVAIANMQYGLDSAVVANLQAMPGFLVVFGYPDPEASGGYAIGGTFQQLISSLLTLGAFLSSLTAGSFAHFFGRKTALWLACLLTAAGCAIQIGTTDKGVVYLGRLVLGIGNGFLVTFSNIYTAEASPAHLRAVMVALFSEWVNVGSIVGSVVTNATQARLDRASYQIPVGILFVVPVLLSVGLFFVPESPRYLVHKGRMDEGRRALEALRGDSLRPEELELEWVEMVRGIEEETRLARTIGPLDQFRGTDLRRTLLCYATILSQVGSGSWFVISYSTYFFVVAGLTTDRAFRYGILNTCLGLVGVNFGIYLMRHVVGRRMILTIGAGLQGVWMLGLGIGCGSVNAVGSVAGNNALIAFMALYQFTYNAFVGDATYPVATELTSTRLRSWTVGSAISIGYFFAWLTGFCSPYFINPENLNWGAKYGYLWAVSNFICMAFFFFFMPELKGRTLEEIDELFANNVSPWKFKTYQTTIQEEALAEVRRQEGLGDEKDPTSEIVEDQKLATSPHIHTKAAASPPGASEMASNNKTAAPDPGPQGYVYTRDTRTRWARRSERDRRADFVKRNVKACTYTPIGYSRQFRGDSPTRPGPVEQPEQEQPQQLSSSSLAAGSETAWEGRGASPVLVPRIVRSQCLQRRSHSPAESDSGYGSDGGDDDDNNKNPECPFRFVSEKRYQAHLLEVHGRTYEFLVAALAQQILASPGEANLYYPRRRPDTRTPGVVERRVPDGPDRLRRSAAELRKEGARVREGRHERAWLMREM